MARPQHRARHRRTVGRDNEMIIHRLKLMNYKKVKTYGKETRNTDI